jgi:hypothetical protein
MKNAVREALENEKDRIIKLQKRINEVQSFNILTMTDGDINITTSLGIKIKEIALVDCAMTLREIEDALGEDASEHEDKYLETHLKGDNPEMRVDDYSEVKF